MYNQNNDEDAERKCEQHFFDMNLSNLSDNNRLVMLF